MTAPRICVPFDKMIALFIFHSLWSALLHPRLSPIIPLIWVQPRLILLILPSKYSGTTILLFLFFLSSSPFSMDYLFGLYLHSSCRWYICAAHSSISSENAKYFVDLHFRLVELFTEANVTASNSKPECGNLISNLPRGLVLD